jgi:TonB family protein
MISLKRLHVVGISAVLAMIIYYPPIGLTGGINLSELGAYRSEAFGKIVTTTRAISSSKLTRILVSIDTSGKVTHCELLKSSGNEADDKRILASIKAIKFLPMKFAKGMEGLMTLRVPVSKNPPPPNSLDFGVGVSVDLHGADGSKIKL